MNATALPNPPDYALRDFREVSRSPLTAVLPGPYRREHFVWGAIMMTWCYLGDTRRGDGGYDRKRAREIMAWFRFCSWVELVRKVEA